MYNRLHWMERERPLARCPVLRCRRSGQCLHALSGTKPCRRTHLTGDEARHELADKLDRMTAELRSRPGWEKNYAAPGTPEFEMRLKMIYDMLRAADQENSAREMAAKRAAADMKNPPAPGGEARGGKTA